MSFCSLEFCLFFPLVLLGLRVCGDRKRNIFLLCASYLFYLWNMPWQGMLMLLITVLSFCFARVIYRHKRKGILGLSIVICFFPLLLYKYFPPVASHLYQAGVLEKNYLAGLLLPVGISFYSFQAVSYLIDVYRGDILPETNIRYYALYLSFFPQLVAGPIERTGHLLPQLKSSRAQIAEADWSRGVAWLLRGYFKKTVVADYLAPFVDMAFGNLKVMQGPEMLAAVAAFAIQIYCDFSGYSDIAVGCARLMGIQLSENFRRPYLATSLHDFWHRWHSSLTRWLTDYIYKPLGGNRKGLVWRCSLIGLVFLVSGIWHGAAFHYVVWGLLHGVFMVLEILMKKTRLAKIIGEHKRLSTVLCHVWVISVVLLGWIFFRAESVAQALEILGRMSVGWAAPWQISYPASIPTPVSLVLRLLLLVQIEQQTAEEGHGQSFLQATKGLIMGTVLFLIWLGGISQSELNAFIYFQF